MMPPKVCFDDIRRYQSIFGERHGKKERGLLLPAVRQWFAMNGFAIRLGPAIEIAGASDAR